MFTDEALREWEIVWLQSDNRIRGDQSLRLVGENSFAATLGRTKRVDHSEHSKNLACSRFRGVVSWPLKNIFETVSWRFVALQPSSTSFRTPHRCEKPVRLTKVLLPKFAFTSFEIAPV